ncbi:MAG: hypothetical protein K8W52_33050 [Deltaproteobacteria bacterium]|nr:hypothetical protein [Deltaproteobacteria bacterium]
MLRSCSRVAALAGVTGLTGLALLAACGGSPDSAPPDATPVTPVSVHPPTAQPAPVDDHPEAPLGPSGALGWTTAPLMTGVQYIPSRDSLELVVPQVAGAVDYRAIVLEPGVAVTADASGRETITNTTVVCAGYLQHSTRRTVRELIDTIQVAGLRGDTRIVLEAIDAPCPFPGVIGAAHADIDRTRAVNTELAAEDARHYTLYTEAEVRAAYGVSLFNGQGVAPRPGDPAPNTAPRVLARTTVVVAPSGTSAAPPVADFFDDFSTDDQPQKISDGATCYPPDCDHPFMDIFQNAKWTFEAQSMDVDQYFIDRGQLHAVVADTAAEDFSTTVAYPRALAQMSDTSYLHVTYEVNALTTARRYPWLSICGADTPGQTIEADGSPRAHLPANSSLQLADGDNPNTDGNNCVMVFSKDGNYVFALPAGDGSSSPPETDMRVLIYKRGTGLTGVNVSPDIYANGFMPHSWFRTIDKNGVVLGPMIDRQDLAAPTSHFDVFVRRGRVIVYVDGQQKLCNDFDPGLVTMAEAMVGFGQVIYHTSAEHNDLAPNPADPDGAFPRTPHVFDNLRFFDRRDWDNLGFESGVQPPTTGPSAFDEGQCYRSAAQ